MSIPNPLSELAAQTMWPVDRIKDQVSKIGSGITPSGGSASYLNAGIPLLRSQKVHSDGFVADQPEADSRMRRHVQELVRERAPWFEGTIGEIVWSAELQFEPGV